MNIPFLGELAAIGTSLSFTIGSVFFTLASRQVGALVLNRTRLLVALLLLSLTHLVLLGTLAPVHASPERWFWLGASGIIGLALGDIFLFHGFTLIGPRLTMLMMSLSPILSTLLAWVFLGERLSLGEGLGIAATLAGITWVVLERNNSPANANAGGAGSGRPHRYVEGLLVGLGASVCQALGLILARNGLDGDFSPISANFIRMSVAAGLFWLVTIFQGQAGPTFSALRAKPLAWRFILVGAFMGPFLGVSLSLLAIQHIEVGIASTLTSLPPVFLLPVSYVVFKERYGWQAIAGTLLAIAGSAILFLV